MPLAISVFSDVICPWCYVGKRRLERALNQLGLRSTTTLEWLPFELNPDIPEEGIERAQYRAHKFGAERGAELDRQMRTTGQAEGIEFAFNRMLRTPNTRRAHMLIAFANQLGQGDQLVTRLFGAYFEDAQDIGDPEILIKLAAEVEIEPQDARKALDSDELRRQVVATEQRASEMGIQGVPFFVLNERWAISGAQSSEHWVQGLQTNFGFDSKPHFRA